MKQSDNHIDKHIIFYVENMLEPSEKVRVETHLQNCERCQKLYANINATLNIIETEKINELNPFFAARVKAMLNAQDMPIKNKVMFNPALLYGFAASFVLLIGIWFGTYRDIPDSYVQDNTTSYKTQFYMSDLDGEIIESYLLANE